MGDFLLDDDEAIALTVEVLAITPHALLVSDGGSKVWIPMSQIAENDNYEVDKMFVITIPEWLAIEKELV